MNVMVIRIAIVPVANNVRLRISVRGLRITVLDFSR